MSLRRIWIPSPNFSSRGGASVRLIVLHTAEGARTIEDLGHFFASSSVQASSHAGADDKPGIIADFVNREEKAWHVAGFNPVAVGLEQCAFASWSREEWMHHPALLDNAARWVAEEAAHFNIPIVKLSAAQAQQGGRGVCQHRDLGSIGGGHNDCGDGYPIDYVLELARGHGANPTPAPKPQEEHNSLLASATSQDGVFHLFSLKDGWIHYSYQKPHEITWTGGEAGKQIAELVPFAPAPGVVSIDAHNHDGTLHVFGRKADGSIVFTYQKPGTTVWAWGETGKQIAGLGPFSPA